MLFTTVAYSKSGRRRFVIQPPHEITQKKLNDVDVKNNEKNVSSNHSSGTACLFFIVRNEWLQQNPSLLNKSIEMDGAIPYCDANGSLCFFYEEDICRYIRWSQRDMSETKMGVVGVTKQIVETAVLLGLAARVYVANGVFLTSIEQDAVHKETIQLLKSSSFISEGVPKLEKGEFVMHLCLRADNIEFFESWNEIFHWIITRPDGSMMEPDTGENFDSLKEYIANRENRLTETGVSIVLKNGTSSPDFSLLLDLVTK